MLQYTPFLVVMSPVRKISKHNINSVELTLVNVSQRTRTIVVSVLEIY